MFGGMAYKIGILAKKATGGGGSDVTLNPTPNWEASIFSLPSITNTETMQGIDSVITLRVLTIYTDNGVEYQKNSGSWIGLPTGVDDISMSNGDSIAFRNNTSQPGVYSQIEVYNYTDGNTLLDTIEMINEG